MQLTADGTLGAGIGDGTVTAWPADAPSPVPIGRGGFGGWLNGRAFGSAPRLGYPGFQPCQQPWPAFMQLESFECNVIVANADKWLASNGTSTIGTVPAGFEHWQGHDIGPDGTVVLVLNGLYRAFWSSGEITSVLAAQVRATAAGLVTVDERGAIEVWTSDGDVSTPQQLDGGKAWVTSIGADWLLYHCFTHGLVCHHVNDASRGYQIPGTYFQSPCGVTLADGRTLIAWSTGAQEQGHLGDLQRMFVRLGDGMQPLTPIEPDYDVPTFPPAGFWFWCLPTSMPAAPYRLSWVGDSVVGADVRGICVSAEGGNQHPLQLAKYRKELADVVPLALHHSQPVVLHWDGRGWPETMEQDALALIAQGVTVVRSISLYPVNGESLAAWYARNEATLAMLAPRGLVSVWLAYYTQQGNWPLQDVLDRQCDGYELVRRFRVLYVNLFDWVRHSGITTHDELLVSALRLLDVAHDGREPWPLPQPMPPIEPPIDPIPPTPEEPMLKPKDRNRYEEKLTDVGVQFTKMDRTQFRQGVREEGDRYELDGAISWSGRALSLSACNRDGAPSVTVPHAAMDPWFKAVKQIDAEELQRG